MKNNNSAKDSPVYLPHAVIPSRTMVWSVMTGVGIALPLFYLCSLVSITNPTEAEVAADTARRAARLAMEPGLLAVKALIIYPILEEVFYRGLIMQLLGRYLPLWIAVLVPTLLFAITHVGDNNSVFRVMFAFLAGLYFSWLVLRTRSLFSAILCHSAVNLTVSFVLTPIFIAHDITSSASRFSPLPLALLTGSVIIFSAGVRILRDELDRRAPRVAAA